MKSKFGIIRRIDDMGRINIPRSVRRNIGLTVDNEAGTAFAVFETEEGILLKKIEDERQGKTR